MKKLPRFALLELVVAATLWATAAASMLHGLDLEHPYFDGDEAFRSVFNTNGNEKQKTRKNELCLLDTDALFCSFYTSLMKRLHTSNSQAHREISMNYGTFSESPPPPPINKRIAKISPNSNPSAFSSHFFT